MKIIRQAGLSGVDGKASQGNNRNEQGRKLLVAKDCMLSPQTSRMSIQEFRV